MPLYYIVMSECKIRSYHTRYRSLGTLITQMTHLNREIHHQAMPDKRPLLSSKYVQ